jgi:hypothetical protein
MSTSFKCEELGSITMCTPKERHETPRQFNQHFRSELDLSPETLHEMQNMARTVAGIESIERSTRRLDNGKTATFVMIMKEGVGEAAAKQTSIDFMHRVTRSLNLKHKNSQRLLSGDGLAVYSSDGQ